MDMFDAIILGIVQGATEFIPISSSGHLIIARDLLGLGENSGLAFDAVLQLATAFALVVYFWKDLKTIAISAWRYLRKSDITDGEKNILLAIIFGTIPAVILGLALEGLMETLFRSVYLVAVGLLGGSILMYYAEKNFTGGRNITIKKGFFLGLFQSLALIPGVSRSGSTISGGMILGLNREEATRFSFLLAFPILFGSGMKKMLDLYQTGELMQIGSTLLIGSICAFIVGLISIRYLLRFVKSNTLMPFIIYRVIIAGIIFIFI